MSDRFVNDKVVDILATCLDDIKQAKRTPDECLGQYPDYQDELTILLDTILLIEQTPLVSPRPAFSNSARRELLEKLPDNQSVTFWDRLRHTWQIPAIKVERRFAMSLIVTLSILGAALLGGWGVVNAASDSLPGETLYGVKLALEDVRLVLADDEIDTTLYGEFAQTRLREMERLMERDRLQEMPLAVDGYKNDITAMMQTMGRLSINEDQKQAMLREIYEIQARFMARLMAKAPPQAQDSLQQALQIMDQLRTQTRDQLQIDQPEGAGQPEETGKPKDTGQPAGIGEPGGAGQPEDAGKPDEAGKPEEAGTPDVGSGTPSNGQQGGSGGSGGQPGGNPDGGPGGGQPGGNPGGGGGHP